MFIFRGDTIPILQYEKVAAAIAKLIYLLFYLTEEQPGASLAEQRG